jgi:hypothetical protein
MSELEREEPVQEPDEERDAAEEDGDESPAPPPDYLDPKPMTPDGR